jgi:hypothetical protein
VDDDHVVRPRELDRALEVAGLDDRARRVVRVVEEEQVGALEPGRGMASRSGRNPFASSRGR